MGDTVISVEINTEREDKTSWRFRVNSTIGSAENLTIRPVMYNLIRNVDTSNGKQVIRLAHGDPSLFPELRTSQVAEDAVVSTLRSGMFNCYSENAGTPSARSAIAEHLNKDLTYKLTPEDVFVTCGCTQAIEILMSVLSNPGANILLPRPGFSFYDVRARFSNLEVRNYDLIPESAWEVDLDSVEKLADEDTVAIVIINPSNPCGSVFTYKHLAKIVETAKKLGIMIIADEVYDHLAFGSTPFIPMGVFGETVPIITLGSISKRWAVPGWRVGWMVTCDPNGILKETRIVEGMDTFLNMTTDPTTFIQTRKQSLVF